MKTLPSILFIGAVFFVNAGCGGLREELLPDESSLKAQIHYIPDGKRVKIVSATTNFDAYREIFLVGFTTGYEDIVGGTLTPIDFKNGANKKMGEFFCSVGYGFGARVAKENLQGQPNGAPTPYVADLKR